MALSTAIAWEVQTGGSDANNSGGFRGGAFISAPSTPSVSNSASGGTVAANTYYVVITYTDGLGETVISPQSSTTTTGSVSTITVTSPGASTGALTWSCYVATVSGGPYFPQGTGLTIGSNRIITTTPPTTGTQPRGVDRSLSTTRFMVLDNSTITATTAGANSNVITFTGYTPTGADVGNVFRTTAGTNITVGFYEVTAITSTTWTVAGAGNLTTAGGAGSAVVGGMGGCFASPAQAASVCSGTFGFYLKSGTYTVGSGTNNTAGNKFTVTNSSMFGYSTNRNPLNTDTPPVLNAGGASMTVMTMSGNNTVAHNISITNSGANATVTGWTPATTTGVGQLISVTGCAVSVGAGMGTGILVDCSDSGCGGMGQSGNGASFIRYVSSGCTAGKAIFTNSGCTLRECVVTGQSGTNSVGIMVTNSSLVSNCVVTGNSGSTTQGITLNGTGNDCENCIVTGYSGTTAVGYTEIVNAINRWRNCADYGNTIAYDSHILGYQKINCVALSGDPFVNAAGGDLSLNSTAGAGAACRAAGIPGTWPGLSTTGYRDIGAAQHADPIVTSFPTRARVFAGM